MFTKLINIVQNWGFRSFDLVASRFVPMGCGEIGGRALRPWGYIVTSPPWNFFTPRVFGR